MTTLLGRALAWLALLAACVLVALSLDWIPARRSAPPEQTAFDRARLVEPGAELAPRPGAIAVAPTAASADAGGSARSKPAWQFEICEANPKSARLFAAPVGHGQAALFVWCRQGYRRIDLVLQAERWTAQHVATFASRAEFPGGVAGADFDGDGVLDLALAAAPPAQVVHRPGAGAFLVRGRQGGGYEPARPLVEAPVKALAAWSGGQRAASDLLVLTRGDIPAQRPGELWLFTGGSSLARAAQIALGVGPVDLVVTGAESGRARAVSAVPQAGALLTVELAQLASKASAPLVQSLPFPGVQGLFSHASATGSLFARDLHDVRELRLPAEQAAGSMVQDGGVASPPTLTTWAQGVNVGPGASADLDADGQVEVIAAAEDGVVRLRGPGSAEETLNLAGQIVDLATLRDDLHGVWAVALSFAPNRAAASLLVLPQPPWEPGTRLEIQEGQLGVAAPLATVALE